MADEIGNPFRLPPRRAWLDVGSAGGVGPDWMIQESEFLEWVNEHPQALRGPVLSVENLGRLLLSPLRVELRALIEQPHLEHPVQYVINRFGSAEGPVRLWHDGEGWVVQYWNDDWVPGPRPDAFEHRWTDDTNAVSDVLQFFGLAE